MILGADKEDGVLEEGIMDYSFLMRIFRLLGGTGYRNQRQP